jgi:hypothetical protein
VWCFTPVISALGRLKEEDRECEVNLDCIGRFRPVYTLRFEVEM